MNLLVQISKDELKDLLTDIIKDCVATAEFGVSKSDSPDGILLTVQEASNSLRVSRATLYKLIKGSKIQTIKIGRKRFIKEAEIVNLKNVQ